MFDKLKKGLNSFVQKITQKTLTEKRLDKALKDLRLTLLQNDVALIAADKICENIKEEQLGEKVGRLENIQKIVSEVLEDSVRNILTLEGQQQEKMDLIEIIQEQNKNGAPAVFVFVGINGTGKTTTIAKIAHFLKQKGFSVVMAASDTFRAGSQEQLAKHAKRVGVKVIKGGGYGSDSAAIAYDAIAHATARSINAVLVDTAGRMQTNKNLMDEMKKIVRVANPDLIIFVGDALAGNDAVSQSEEFNNAVGIDCSILTKIDADARGGTALSIVSTIQKPILFVGTGQGYDDLEAFDAEWFVERIF